MCFVRLDEKTIRLEIRFAFGIRFLMFQVYATRPSPHVQINHRLHPDDNGAVDKTRVLVYKHGFEAKVEGAKTTQKLIFVVSDKGRYYFERCRLKLS